MGICLTYYFNDRAELVAFGEKLGQALHRSHRNQPWMIRLDGDFNSGKSLVALAVDKGFRPEAYPNGLQRDIPIHILMPDRNAGLHTVFCHFGHIVRESRTAFDQELNEFETKHPAARVLIASNIDRTITGYNDLQEDGLNSNRLDLAVQVLKGPGKYERHVSLFLKDPALKAAMLS